MNPELEAHSQGACDDDSCPYCYENFRAEIRAEKRYWRFIEDCARAAILIGVVAAFYIYYRFHY